MIELAGLNSDDQVRVWWYSGWVGSERGCMRNVLVLLMMLLLKLSCACVGSLPFSGSLRRWTGGPRHTGSISARSLLLWQLCSRLCCGDRRITGSGAGCCSFCCRGRRADNCCIVSGRFVTQYSLTI